MPVVRTPVKSKKPELSWLEGLLYARDEEGATPTYVPTMSPAKGDGPRHCRFPSESIMGAQDTFHESWVTCQDTTGKSHCFLVAAQYASDYEFNLGLRKILPEIEWKGGLIVMRRGRHPLIVNMGGKVYKMLAEQAVRKYLLETAPLIAQFEQYGIPLHIPTHM